MSPATKALALAALLAGSAPAHAQVYKCVDERGVTHYSDKPRPGCKDPRQGLGKAPPASGKAAASVQSPARQKAESKRRKAERQRPEPQELAALEQRCRVLREQQAFLSRPLPAATPADTDLREKQLAQVQHALRACP